MFRRILVAGAGTVFIVERAARDRIVLVIAGRVIPGVTRRALGVLR